jgi:hypothetical protein
VEEGNVVVIKHSLFVLKAQIASAVVLALVLTLILGAQALAAVHSSAVADTPTPVRVTDNTSMDAYAEVSGDRIVWLEATDMDNPDEQQVFTWTPTDGVTHLSTTSTMNQWPMVSGDRVVWFGAGGTDGGDDNEVFTWTLTGGLVQLTTDDVDEQGVQVSGDRVVWNGHDSSMIYQIYTWTPSGVTTKLSDEATGAFSPAVSGDRIAWVNGQKVVYTWTQASGPVAVSVLENMGSKNHLRVSGDRVAYSSDQHVWTWTPALEYAESISDPDAGLFDLSGDRMAWQHWNGTAYELTTWTPAGGAVVIATDTGGEGFAWCRISGNRIVWRPSSEDSPNVYTWTSGGGTIEVAADSSGPAVSGDRIVWCSGNGANSEIYTAVYTVTTPTRYEQTDGNIVKTGTWADYGAPLASEKTYGRSSTSGASATVWFNGTKIAWIGMTGGTPGIVDVYIDDEKKATLDLYSSPPHYQVALYTSDALSNGIHHMDLVRDKDSLSSEFLVLDAVDIWGTILAAPPTITTLSPGTGSVDGGTSVTINGTNFIGLTGASAVTFGGVNATSYNVVSSTKITAVAPAHGAGAVTVQVATSSGSATSSFTYAVTTRVDMVNTTALVTPGTSWSGTWAPYTSASAFSGAYMRSSTANASVIIAFQGTQLDWVSMKGTTGAIADIYVDGSATKTTSVNLYASPAVYQQNLFSTGTLPNGYHTVKIVRSASSASGRYLTIDAIELAGTLVGFSRLQETDPFFTWNPAMTSWTLGTTTSASGGTYRYINTAGAYVGFSFNGVGFKLIAKTAPSYGNLTVTIDGVSQTVSLYSSATTYKKVVLTAFMAPGSHTVKIARAGTKSSSSTGYTIDLDAIDLFGEW